MDRLPDTTVRLLKTLRLHLDIADQDALQIIDGATFSREYPLPEVRDIRRKLEAMQSTIEEILS
jgi:hypothetical protein